MHISIVNIDAHKEQQIKIKTGFKKISGVNGRILRSAKLQDHNTFEAPDKVQPVNFSELAVKDENIEFSMPPFSVIVLEVKM